jgi:hypothetical protein
MVPGRSAKRKGAKKGKSPRGPVLRLERSYPNQPVVTHMVPCASIPLSFTVTTGIVSAAIDFAATVAVLDWTPRFTQLYEEFRVVSGEASIQMMSSSNTGVMCFFWDEKTSTAPTAGAANERALIRKSCSDITKAVVTWHARDLADLAYQPIGTTYHPVFLKVYTDTANFNAPITAIPAVVISCRLIIQFRGFVTQ